MKKKTKIWQWILFVFLLCTFFVYIKNVGIFMLAAAALVFPIDKWQAMIGRYLKKYVKIAAISILVLCGIIFAPKTSAKTDTAALESPASSVVVTTESPTTLPQTTAVTTTTATTAATTKATTAATTKATTSATTKAETSAPATTVKETASSAGAKESSEYILNQKSKVFHRPDCRAAAKIQSANKSTFTGSRDDLIAQGYTSCGICHP